MPYSSHPARSRVRSRAAASRIACISACAVGSGVVITALTPSPTMRPACTITAPKGWSPRSMATRRSSNARCMNVSRPGWAGWRISSAGWLVARAGRAASQAPSPASRASAWRRASCGRGAAPGGNDGRVRSPRIRPPPRESPLTVASRPRRSPGRFYPPRTGCGRATVTTRVFGAAPGRQPQVKRPSSFPISPRQRVRSIWVSRH